MSDIPASWQPDPRGRHEYRYWDGEKWTDHVSDKGEVSQDPVDDETPAAAAGSPAAEPATEVQAVPDAQVDSEPEPVVAETPAEADPEPVVVSEPVAVTPEPEPVVIEPEPVVVEPDPVVVEPDPVVVEPTPEPVPAASAPAATSAPPPGGATVPSGSATTPSGGASTPSTAQTDAKAAAQDVLHSKSPELATIMTAAVPGSGHFYMGTDKVPLAAGLLVATLAALILSWMSFLFFIIGFVLWAGAVVFGLNDLRGGVKGIEDTALAPNVVGILLIGAGVLLVVSLLLPYYHVSFEVKAAGFSQSGGGNVNGFESFGIIDIVLLAVGVASVIAGAASLGLGPVTAAELPRQLPMAVAVGGAIAAVLILFRMFIDPAPGLPGGIDADVDIGRGFGIWFGLWASLILVLANAGLLRTLSNRT